MSLSQPLSSLDIKRNKLLLETFLMHKEKQPRGFSWRHQVSNIIKMDQKVLMKDQKIEYANGDKVLLDST